MQQFVRQSPKGHPPSSPFALFKAHGKAVHHLRAYALRLGKRLPFCDATPSAGSHPAGGMSSFAHMEFDNQLGFLE